MNRKVFIKNCGAACIGGSLLALLQSCGGSKIVAASMNGSDLIVLEKEFEIIKKDEVRFRTHLVAQHDQLQYPVCIYRSGSTNYTALWMRCTHQGTELQVFGDKLYCPAHGSEFNNKGGVENGPAADPLRSFPVVVADGQIKISLK